MLEIRAKLIGKDQKSEIALQKSEKRLPLQKFSAHPNRMIQKQPVNAIFIPRIFSRSDGHSHTDYRSFILFQTLQTGLFYQCALSERGKGRNQQPAETPEPAGTAHALSSHSGNGAGICPAFYSDVV